MYIREDNLDEHLSRQEPKEFDLVDLKRNLRDTPTLQVFNISQVWCYRSGVHDFLVFQLIRPQGSHLPSTGRIWMRLERGPITSRRRNPFSFSRSSSAPARDTYSINYHCDALMAHEEGRKLIAALNLESDLSLSDVADLMEVVHNVSSIWKLFGTNCRWLCAVTLDALKVHFNGYWMEGGPARRFLEFSGAESSAARQVKELYHPQYRRYNCPSISNSLLPVTKIPSAVSYAPDLSLGSNTHSDVRPISETSNGDTRALPKDLEPVQKRALTLKCAIQSDQSSSLSQLLSLLEEQLSINNSAVNFSSTMLVLNLFEDPETVWDCICINIMKVLDRDPYISTKNLFGLISTWINICRLPSLLLGEIANLLTGLSVYEDFQEECMLLSHELRSIVIFGLYERRWPEIQLRAEQPVRHKISFEHAASVLGYMETAVRSKYLASEIVTYYAHHCKHRINTNHRQTILPFYETVSVWVKSSILFDGEQLQDTEERIQTIKYFIDIAKECHNQHNYATADSIVNSIRELNLSGFKITMKRTEKDLKDVEKLRLGSQTRTRSRTIHMTQPVSEPIYPLKLDPPIGLIDEIISHYTDNCTGMTTRGYTNLLTRICSEITLSTHRTTRRELRSDSELSMCAILVWGSMEYAARGHQRLNRLADIVTELQTQEATQHERFRRVTLGF
ncbi:hypothetical protein B0J17DRAFT_224453 [Rhizoctonia solani]|nr:hypothetical protein B0J17DRAFT_224453 [Rhizoctonia solani]